MSRIQAISHCRNHQQLFDWRTSCTLRLPSSSSAPAGAARLCVPLAALSQLIRSQAAIPTDLTMTSEVFTTVPKVKQSPDDSHKRNEAFGRLYMHVQVDAANNDPIYIPLPVCTKLAVKSSGRRYYSLASFTFMRSWLHAGCTTSTIKALENLSFVTLDLLITL